MSTAAPTPTRTPSLAIVGGGVRGTAALGRLAAHLTANPRFAENTPSGRQLELHLIDPHPLGSGRIWRAGQPHTLVMNTVAAQSTVFDDDSLGFAQRCPGPTFAEWCAGIAAGSFTLAEADQHSDEAHELITLASATQPWDSPSRALYGAYLRWAHHTLVAQLPEWVTVHTHRARAVALERTVAGTFTITLDTGSTISTDAALLAVGWLPRPHADTHNIGPESPIDQPVGRIAAGEHVAVRGVGMGFTDLCSLVTECRGGSFTPAPTPERPLAVHYTRGGSEPTLHAGSRTGMPFLAKPRFGTVPPAADFVTLRALTPELLEIRKHAPLDFTTLILPLIERDSALAHYRTLAQHSPSAYALSPEPLLALLSEPPTFTSDLRQGTTEPISHTIATALRHDAHQWRSLAEQLVPNEADRYSSARIATPIEGHTDTAIDTSITERLIADATQASLGARSAQKMGWHTFQAARGAIVPLTDFGGVSPDSSTAHSHYLYLAGLAGSGPPLFRVEQLIALHEAGVVRFVGPDMNVTPLPSLDSDLDSKADANAKTNKQPRYAVWSTQAPGDRTTVTRIVDAFLSLPQAERLNDPLLNSLRKQGLARPAGTTSPAAGAIGITADSSTLVDTNGDPIAGIASVGVLHEAVRQFTIIAPIPGANSTVLREIDAATTSVLQHALNAPHPAQRYS